MHRPSMNVFGNVDPAYGEGMPDPLLSSKPPHLLFLIICRHLIEEIPVGSAHYFFYVSGILMLITSAEVSIFRQYVPLKS